MSVLNPSSDPKKPYKKSFHWRSDSEELDVFEAAGYFSTAANDPNPGSITSSFQKLIREERHHRLQKPAGRMSLDRNPIAGEFQEQMIIKDGGGGSKKFKQPSSPGGRLASFLNSLFNQASLKKKKPKSGAPTRDDEISPGGRRKRRSSISHFRITTTEAEATAPADSKADVFPSSSGFRTAPPYVDTPTKWHREFKNFPDRRRETAEVKAGPASCEKLRVSNSKSGFSMSNSSCPSDEKEFRKFSDDGDDDGADSDSSSDLFDLPNHDLDFYSSGLPVYGTTDMDRIKMGAPIPSVIT